MRNLLVELNPNEVSVDESLFPDKESVNNCLPLR